MKRILAFFLVTAMCFAAYPICSFATTTTDSQGLTYELSSDGTYYIVSDCDESATEIVIPETYEGLPVKKIKENAFSNHGNLISIDIAESITEIGIDAFFGCISLDSVSFANVTTICEYAFGYCWNIESLSMPNVTTIGERAFYGCFNLSSVSFPKVEYIGNYAFEYSNVYNSGSMKSIEIPESLTSIGVGAFSNCGIETITVAEGNERYISKGNCLIDTTTKTLVQGTKDSIIPTDGSVTAIGDKSFVHCYFNSLELPSSITTIGDSAFSACRDLVSVTMPGVTIIGDSAFSYCENLVSISMPNVTAIGDYAFNMCEGLTSVVIPGSVTNIGESIFRCIDISEGPDGVDCSQLTDIYCEAESQPAGWNERWTGCEATVHWGYTPNPDPDPNPTPNPEPTPDPDLEPTPDPDPNPDPTPEITVGDITGNGKLDARDYLLLKRAYFGTYTVTCDIIVLDINGNGKLDPRDYILLKRAYFGTYTIG